MKMKLKLIALCSILSLSVLSVGGSNLFVVDAAASDWFDKIDGPTDYFQDDKPKRIVANVGEDASTQMHVTWQINKNVTDQYIIYTPYVDVTYAKAKKVQATISTFSMPHEEFDFASYLERNLCRVDLSDLTPGVKYRYRVGNDSYLSEEYNFETSTGEGDFTFAVISDPQAVKSVNYSQTIYATNKIIQEDKAKFLMIGGDISELAGVEGLYAQFFETQNILKKMPIVTIPGNHETLLYEEVTTGSYYHEHPGEYRAYSAHFYNPSNGPEFSLNSTYYYKYNDCLFLMINTQFNSGELKQIASWIDDVITNNPSKYIIAMMHKGCYGNRYYGSMDSINSVFGPVFDKHKLYFLLSWHDHTWARTYPVSNFRKVNNENDGVIYCIVGSPGPKLYEPALGAEVQFAFSNTKTLPEGVYSYITVNDDGIRMQANYLSGGVLDDFFIPAKRDSQGNKLANDDTNLSINVETVGTTAMIDLKADTLNNVSHLSLENIDGSEIRKLDRHSIDFTLTELNLNSKYDYQIRVVYNDGTSKVNKFSFETKSSLEIVDNELKVNKFIDNVSKYNVYLNDVFAQTLFFDETYKIPQLKKGNYLIKVEQLVAGNPVCYDYIFIVV